MSKYVKLPVEIDAFQWTLDYDMENPKWFVESIADGVIVEYDDGSNLVLLIETLEGRTIAFMGDYIIKGVNGEIYSCKPDIFKKTYRKV